VEAVSFPGNEPLAGAGFLLQIGASRAQGRDDSGGCRSCKKKRILVSKLCINLTKLS
jgi:hypothetical protein